MHRLCLHNACAWVRIRPKNALAEEVKTHETCCFICGLAARRDLNWGLKTTLSMLSTILINVELKDFQWLLKGKNGTKGTICI